MSEDHSQMLGTGKSHQSSSRPQKNEITHGKPKINIELLTQLFHKISDKKYKIMENQKKRKPSSRETQINMSSKQSSKPGMAVADSSSDPKSIIKTQNESSTLNIMNTSANSSQICDENFPQLLSQIECSLGQLKKFYENTIQRKEKKKSFSSISGSEAMGRNLSQNQIYEIHSKCSMQ